MNKKCCEVKYDLDVFHEFFSLYFSISAGGLSDKCAHSVSVRVLCWSVSCITLSEC